MTTWFCLTHWVEICWTHFPKAPLAFDHHSITQWHLISTHLWCVTIFWCPMISKIGFHLFVTKQALCGEFETHVFWSTRSLQGYLLTIRGMNNRVEHDLGSYCHGHPWAFHVISMSHQHPVISSIAGKSTTSFDDFPSQLLSLASSGMSLVAMFDY